MRFFKLLSLMVLTGFAVSCGSNQSTNPVLSGNNSTVMPMSVGQGTPIYSGSTIVGYRYHSILAGGTQTVYAGGSYETNVSVTAGSRVYINQNIGMYTEYGYCSRSLFKYKNSNAAPLRNISASLNGVAVTNNTLISSSGALAIRITPVDLNMDCTVLNSQRAQPISYTLYLTRMGSSVAEMDSCTNVSGAAMNCP